MKKMVSLILILSLVIIAAAAGIMTVAAIPQIPESYWGYAILKDEPAPIGTQMTVEVYGTGEVVGSSTIQYEAGLYVMKVMIDDPASPEDEGADNGDLLTWKLNGIECRIPALGTDTAESGGINNNFSIVAPSPDITNATDTTIPKTKNNAAKINGENNATNVTPRRPGPPSAPESYWGHATFDGVPAAINTTITVEVYDTGEEVGNTTVADTNGLYTLDVYISNINNLTDDGCAINGDSLTWKINGIVCRSPAPGTDTAVSGRFSEGPFNISASRPTTPAPTSVSVSVSAPKINWVMLLALALSCIIALVIIAVIVNKVKKIGK